MAKFCVYTLGCKVNQVESDSLTAMLLERGHVLDQADYEFAIINGCAVTQTAEKKSSQLVERIKKKAPTVKIIFAGCATDKLTEAEKLKLNCYGFVSNADKHKLPDLFESANQSAASNDIADTGFAEYSFEQYPRLRTRAFIKIQDGCDNYCSYCIIPYLRGGVRSRSLASIVREVNSVVSAGFKEVVLTGIHLGNYGKEAGFAIRLDDVVERILRETTIPRIRLGSIESPEISTRLLDLFENEPRLCRHLHLPLQSGCDATLQRMNRKYQTEDYQVLVDAINDRFPDMAVTADIIVGFPGETNEEFAAACAFVERLPLAGLHVFPFSRRSGTAAWSLPGQIDGELKKQRAKTMTEIGSRLQQKFRTSCLRRQTNVLFENVSDEYAYGFSDNYQKIYVPKIKNLKGKICPVQPDEIYRDGLCGKLV
ncbi:MAG: tRNA (N(6)-L-threonylcarbamoyladenosine(37)-C(2))-methylthiotransferase MtaB [Negativicutes bacterium]|jgi:threonylcarbamoyladenosine tRNA methylthiotransferase MtaB